MSSFDYDLLVIGAGSGAIGSGTGSGSGSGSGAGAGGGGAGAGGGATGGGAGATGVREIELAGPVPTELTARTSMVAGVPFVRLEMVTDVFAVVDQAPPFARYW